MRKPKPPTYQRHKASGQAKVRIRGRDIYLGPYGSAESRAKYRQVLAEWETAQAEPQPAVAKPAGPLTVADLILAHQKWCEKRISPKQAKRFLAAASRLRPWLTLRADEFGLAELEAVRDKMVQAGWSRGYINSLVGCIRRVWKYGARYKLVPASAWQDLKLLEDLRRGELGVRETERVRPVDRAVVLGTLYCLRPPVAAMVRLQLLTGMRTGEVLILRPMDVDRAGPVWIYRPAHHKNEKRGQERTIHLGPRAQAVLTPFLARAPSAYCFSPREALDGRPGGGRASLRDHYDNMTYPRAVARACIHACEPGWHPPLIPRGVPPWHPYQLRHTFATAIRAAHGPDAARAALGQKTLQSTMIYAELDLKKVEEIASKAG